MSNKSITYVLFKSLLIHQNNKKLTFKASTTADTMITSLRPNMACHFLLCPKKNLGKVDSRYYHVSLPLNVMPEVSNNRIVIPGRQN